MTVSNTLRVGSNQTSGFESEVVAASLQVRRLPPTKEERLQSFPDGFTAIPWRNKPAQQCPDGPRYKTLGNSIATHLMRWIGERIRAALQESDVCLRP